MSNHANIVSRVLAQRDALAVGVGQAMPLSLKLTNVTSEPVELAERIGMSVAYLGQIERGNRGNSFSLETLYQIADALKIDVNLLIKNEMLA